jgi:predicted ATPase
MYEPELLGDPAANPGSDVGVSAQCFMADVLWFLGLPDQAVALNAKAAAMAQTLDPPFSLAVTLALTLYLYQRLGDPQRTLTQAETLNAFATEQGFPYWANIGVGMGGWARSQLGEVDRGIEQIHAGLAVFRSTGALSGLTWLLAMLADACNSAGRVQQGLATIVDALGLLRKTDERFHAADLYRLRAEFLMQQGDLAEAESCLLRSLDTARRQRAQAWRLRAAMTLAALWSVQGQRQKAATLLAPVYREYTEGFATADLLKARRLLRDLS